MSATAPAPSVEAVRARLRTVKDPELPAVDVVGLGIVREIAVDDDGTIRVALTPTYSGCPALDVIRRDVEHALAALGPAEVRVVLSPPWTTDWIEAEAKRALAASGIAPPPPRADSSGFTPRCPRCDADAAERRSEFGSTACKSLWVCGVCREPFELLKVI